MAIFNSYVSLSECMFIAIFDDRVWFFAQAAQNHGPKRRTGPTGPEKSSKHAPIE